MTYKFMAYEYQPEVDMRVSSLNEKRIIQNTQNTINHTEFSTNLPKDDQLDS